jgi:hypothetical protein
MIYQVIYSSESTTPMQTDDLEELLEQARANNITNGITGALIYADGVFLQILEGDKTNVQHLLAKIRRDLRHETITVLRESEIPSATFGSWKMAFVSATREQVARWAGFSAVTATSETQDDNGQERLRIAQFAQDILALLAPETTEQTKVA